MLKKGQIIELKHKAKMFFVDGVFPDKVVISFQGGHSYEVHRNGYIYDLNYRHSDKRELLRQSNDKKGYKMVAIRANGKSVQMKVHRLVALCFLPNPNNLPIINHKDEDPSNNNASNLEWCDQKYNVNYSLSKTIEGCKKRKLHMSAKLTKDKVFSMLPKDCIFIPCDTAAECESVYQTALQAKRGLGENGNRIAVSKSNVTLSVVLRTGL